MNQSQSIFKLLYNLWHHINQRRRRQFLFLLFLVVFASFAEIISIGAVIPFLGVLTAPDKIFEHTAAQPFIDIMGFTEPGQLLLPLAIAFGIAAILAGLMRLLVLWVITRISYATGADLSINIYNRTLYQPYYVHVNRNSSEVISGIVTKANNVISRVIMPTLTIISSFIMLSLIMIALFSIDPFIAFLAFVGFGSIYILIIWLTKNQLLKDSHRIAYESTQVVKSLQEGLGGIRDVLIDGSQDVYCQIYRNADYALRRAQGNNIFIGQSPRYVMEALGMLLIAILVFILSKQEDDIASAIPILGALALGAQRLLPVLQNAYASWSSIRGGQVSLRDTLELLEQKLPDYVDQPVNLLPFKDEISINQLSFHYSKEPSWVLKKLNLKISKGSRVGFIGTTGSGKSTLIDIVMGLLQPTEGTIEIDGQLINMDNYRDWQMHIAHVPQTIFLADSSIEENIAFGVPKEKIDHQRVIQAANQAQISNIIDTWPKKYETTVGEQGIRLSGGQRQRIGIARALYKKADVIIFDEATSALDTETEQAVMQAIENLSENLTILIVAHRLTTLKNCTQVIELSNGKIKRKGTYQQIVNQLV
jgi:ATP-binding cassette, subfamily B, bacterial PglK